MALTKTISPVATILTRRPTLTSSTDDFPTLSKPPTLSTNRDPPPAPAAPSSSLPRPVSTSPSHSSAKTPSLSVSSPSSCPTRLNARSISTLEFTWSTSDEPHVSRRREILAKYPEIAQLFGTEPLTFPIILAIFTTQMFFAYLVSSMSLSWPLLFLLAWTVGGTLNHSLQLAVHELSHNLCFDSALANKCAAIFANLATGFPSSVSFQKYHMDHHQWQGVDGIDTDIPTRAEIALFSSSVRKVLWILLQPVFYAVRPTIVKPKPYGKWELINIAVQIVFNVCVAQTLGIKGLSYMIIGTLLGLGLHPAAGHFVAEHYELVSGQETYSYYGPCNYVNFNVGYHNEHHDFPRIPWSRLPLVPQIAPEYYLPLPYYTSYLALFYAYITDSKLGPHARIKRKPAAITVDRSGLTVEQRAKQKKRWDGWSFVFIAIGWFSVCIGYVLYNVMYS